MPGSEPIQSVVRAAQVLELIGQSPAGLGVGDLASRLGVKPPTVHHLLRTMVQAGLLKRTAGPVLYHIGPLVRSIAANTGKADLHTIVSQVMPQLAEDLADLAPNVVLAEHLDHEIVVTLRMSADKPGIIQHPAHQTMNGYTASSSLIFQAHWPTAQLQKFRQSHPFEEYNTAWRDLATLDAALAQVRDRGHALHLSQDKLRAAASAPVFDEQGRIVAAIGSSIISPGPIAPGVQQRLVAAVARAAQAIHEQRNSQANDRLA